MKIETIKREESSQNWDKITENLHLNDEKSSTQISSFENTSKNGKSHWKLNENFSNMGKANSKENTKPKKKLVRTKKKPIK